MTNARILHAAARGAKWQAQKHPGVWVDYPDARVIQIQANPQNFRIHPDDLALQYGPISTALREAASAGNAWDLSSDYGKMAIAYSGQSAWWLDDETRSFYLLLCAEALADEGL